MATAVTTSERWPTIAGKAIGIIGVVLSLATLALVLLDLDSAPRWKLPGLSAEWTYAWRVANTLLGTSTISIIAALIIRRQPRSPFSWTFAAAAMLYTITMFASQYAIHGLVVQPGSLPLADAVARLRLFDYQLLVGCYLFAALLFPDGRLLSPRWRILAGVMVIAVVLDGIRQWDAPYPLWMGVGGSQSIPVTGPPELWAIGASMRWFAPWMAWGIFAIFGALALHVVLRLRRATGETRLQLKWFTYAVAFGVAGSMLMSINELPNIPTAFRDAIRPLTDWAQEARDFTLGILLPLSIGIAILRYRLYDIDVVINRTIVYGGLALFVTLTYGVIVAAVGAALGQSVGLGPVATVLAIALIAVLLEPVRARLHALANIAIYGRRANPYEVLSDFAQSVGAAARADVLLPRMAALVRDATHAAEVEVWVRVGDQLQLAASAPPTDGSRESVPNTLELEGRAGAVGTVVPVFLDADPLGALLVRKPRGESLTVTERRLLSDLASQAGLVFSRFRLVEELRESRTRIVAAQDEERRRIERDLHDGAQQRFVNAMLSVGMAQAVEGSDKTSAELLEQATREMQAGLSELRALARGLHPPLLTDEGLPAAIASLADRSPILTSVAIHAERRYTEPVEVTAYFVVAEALANAAKHSHASNIAIRLDEIDGKLRVEVEDDGVGGVDLRRGSGLTGLKDRAAAVGGRLAFDSDGHGTTVRAEIPCA
ncbi:MAG TPA: sensor histidine kinase [Candidatus Limnocylindria bacterium]